MSIYDNLPNKVSLAGKVRKIEEEVYGVNEEYPGLIRPYELGKPVQDEITEINQNLLLKEDVANKEQTLSDDVNSYPSSYAVTQALLSMPKPLRYIGDWDADQNIPELSDYEDGKEGFMYRVIQPGSQFGLTFNYGDFLVYNANFEPEVWDMGDIGGFLPITGGEMQGGIDMKLKSITFNKHKFFSPDNPDDVLNLRRYGQNHTLLNLMSPPQTSWGKAKEATLALVRGDGNEYFLDLYNMDYGNVDAGNNMDYGNPQMGIRLQKRGGGVYTPFNFEYDDNVNRHLAMRILPRNTGGTVNDSVVEVENELRTKQLIFKNKGYGNKFGFEPDFSSATKKLHLKSVLDNTAGADPALNKTIATFDSDGNTYFPTHDNGIFTIGNLDFFYSTIRNRDNIANGMYIGDDFNEMLAPGGFYIFTDNDNSKLVVNGESYSHHTFGKQYLQGDTLPTPADGTSDTYMVTGNGLATDEGVLSGSIRGHFVYDPSGTRHGNMINISRKDGVIYMYNIGGTEVNPLTFADTLPIVMDLTSWDYLKLIRMP